MANYKVTIIETTVAMLKQVYQADSAEEAEEIARCEYESGMMSRDAFEISDDDDDVIFNVELED